ncbi:hypothetical protein I4U23_000946 [Adineta vaga]|nr:hypothetical protein I4U23_000946 [Adineta vaga]
MATQSNSKKKRNNWTKEDMDRHREIEKKRRELEQKLLKELKSLISNWDGQTSANLTQLNVLQFAKDKLEKINQQYANQEVLPSFLTTEENHFLNLETNNTFIFIITIQDGMFRIRYVNESINRILQFSPEQWINQNFLSFIHEDDLHLFQYQMMSLIHQPNQKLSTKCRLRRNNRPHILINIDGVIKNTKENIESIPGNNLGHLLFIGIGHLPLISEYNDKNMSLYKEPELLQTFSCRCSPNDWKIFLVDGSTTTLPLVSFEIFRNRSILDFIDQKDQPSVHQHLIKAMLKGTDESVFPCRFIYTSISVDNMLLSIKPFVNSNRGETNFLELTFSKFTDDSLATQQDISDILAPTDELDEVFNPQ